MWQDNINIDQQERECGINSFHNKVGFSGGLLETRNGICVSIKDVIFLRILGVSGIDDGLWLCV
jgi:hypothetical protein